MLKSEVWFGYTILGKIKHGKQKNGLVGRTTRKLCIKVRGFYIMSINTGTVKWDLHMKPRDNVEHASQVRK